MLTTRILTAAVLLPIAVGALYLGGKVLLAFSLMAFIAINWEYFSFSTRFSPIKITQAVLLHLFLPAGYLLGEFAGLGAATLLCLIIWFLILLLHVEGEEHEPFTAELVPACLLGFSYVGILGSLLVVISSGVVPREVLGWIIAITIATDTCAYFGGKAFGARKFAERISPNKTVAGSVFGLLGAVGVGWFLAGYLFEESCWVSIVLQSLVVGIFVQIGDLFESLVKRIYKVKDSGNTLPGHGGVLDRVDGLLFAVPAILFFYINI